MLCVSIYMFTYINLYKLSENATRLKFDILNSVFICELYLRGL
nr:MAG TPA: hypothetical protein [Caudoviricetes sp.]